MSMELTPEKIREIFDYDSESGLLFWKIKPARHVKVGDVTGCLGSKGYLSTVFCGKQHYTHRLIFVWFHGRWPKVYIDHVNNIKTDNRITNLRESTRIMDQY